jgi:hypothetical protein
MAVTRIKTHGIAHKSQLDFRIPTPTLPMHITHLYNKDKDKENLTFFTFMWPCIATNFFFNKTKKRTNFPNLFLSRKSTCFGQFHCLSSGFFHCTSGTGICHAGLMRTFKHDQDSRAWKLSSNLYDIYQCLMYSGKLLIMGRGTARKM